MKLVALVVVLALCAHISFAQDDAETSAPGSSANTVAGAEAAAGSSSSPATSASSAANTVNQGLNTNKLNPNLAAGEASSAIADPLNLGATENLLRDSSAANTLPPFTALDADNLVSPNLGVAAHTTLNLDIDKRIKQTEDLINRMTWQLNRETAWANAVHDIIQNYQYKYTKVLASIKSHSSTMEKMRDLSSQLKKARLHEILEADLAKAQNELDELKMGAAEGSESADGKSYGALVDRVALIKADLEKMGDKKVHQVVHNVEKDVKAAAAANLPPPSDDTLAGLLGESSKPSL